MRQNWPLKKTRSKKSRDTVPLNTLFPCKKHFLTLLYIVFLPFYPGIFSRFLSLFLSAIPLLLPFSPSLTLPYFCLYITVYFFYGFSPSLLSLPFFSLCSLAHRSIFLGRLRFLSAVSVHPCSLFSLAFSSSFFSCFPHTLSLSYSVSLLFPSPALSLSCSVLLLLCPSPAVSLSCSVPLLLCPSPTLSLSWSVPLLLCPSPALPLSCYSFSYFFPCLFGFHPPPLKGTVAWDGFQA